MSTHNLRALIALLILAALLQPAAAQVSRGSITGLATDSSGAVIPGVKVTAKNTKTAVASSTTTNSTGNYTILYLTPGVYDFTAEFAGFTTIQRPGIEVQVGDRLQIDFPMQPVAQASSVVVSSGDTPLLSVESAASGTVIGQRQISDLPLPYGNPFMLASLASGVVFTSANMLQIRPYDNSVVANIRTDGAPGGNEFTLDGAPNTATTRGTQKGLIVAYVPPSEAVQEFKMETASFDARQGHAPGAAVNVSLKSGTNDVHGAAWEFTRPPSLVANDFFLRRAGRTPSDLTLHRFGASFGGPIYLPKIYNGRNRSFFYFTYENMMTDQPNGSFQTVPTAAQRQGDFSALLAQKITIYDPLTAVPAAGGRIQRSPFPNNTIPAARLSPIAQNVLKYYPLPNGPGDAQGANNYTSNNIAIDRYHSEIARLDHYFSDRNRFSTRLDSNFRNSPSTGWSGGLVNGISPTEGLGHRGNSGVSLDHVFLATPSDVIDMRGGVTRYFVGNGQMAHGFDPASLGFPAATVALFDGARYLPSFAPSGYGSIGSGGGDFTAHNTWFLQPTYSKLKGKHSLHAGYEARADRENTIPSNNPAGTYSFANTYTKGPLDNSSGAPVGQSIASMLIGLPTGGSIDRNATSAVQAIYQALFVQDEFKISRRLSLDLGLRYEWESPTTDRYNRNVRGFDTTTPSPIAAAAGAAYAASSDPALSPADFHLQGGLLFTGSNHRDFWNHYATAIQPRIGAAFELTPKTVLRGGFGLYMIPFGVDGVFQPGFSQTTAILSTLDSGLTFAASLANPFPNGVIQPSGSTAGLATYLGQSISFTPTRQTGKVERWQIGIQRELPGRSVVEVIYAGTRGDDMTVPTDVNALPAQYLSTSPVRDQKTIDFLTAKIPNPMAGLLGSTTLSGSTVSRSQLLLPYPQFAAINSEIYNGSTRYQGVEIRASHRFRSGFTLNGSYSHSRLRERLSLLNASDTSPENRVSGDDRPNRFTMNGIWELPFGKGRKFGRNWNRFVDGVLGGWQLTGVYVVQSGRPISLGDLYFTGDPNQLHATYDKNKLNAPIFNISQFYFHDAAVQTNGVDDPVKQRADMRIQLANNIRTLPSMFPNFRGDRVWQLDSSLIKTLRVTERIKIQIRGEVINTLNQVQFNNPGTSPVSASFGLIAASSQLNPPRTTQLGFKITW